MPVSVQPGSSACLPGSVFHPGLGWQEAARDVLAGRHRAAFTVAGHGMPPGFCWPPAS